jgi:gamma-tubulin complex component 3
VSKPFFSTLHKWLFSGELYDPYNEFFVSVDPDIAHVQYLLHPSLLTGGGDGMFGALAGDAEDMSADRESGLRLWETKYRFRKDMLPMFVGEAFGKKVSRSTGRAVHQSQLPRSSPPERASTSSDTAATTATGLPPVKR